MRKGGLLIAALFSLLALLAAACGGNGEPTATQRATSTPQPTPTPQATPTPAPTSTPQPTATTPGQTQPTEPAAELVARGRDNYLKVPANVAPQALWCFHCHKIDGIPEAAGLIGPDHTHVGRDAVTRVPGMSAEDYLRESIVNPELRVAEGVERATPGLMTTAIVGGLTDEQVDALVAFLLTLQ